MNFAIEHFENRNCNRRMRERILITGPGGRVGTQIVPLLREHFALRLFDTQHMATAVDDEFVNGDIRDFDALLRACTGVSAVLHLAAISDEDDFHSKLLPVNLAGTYNVFEAARQAGVKKFLFPSTGQTVLNNPRGQRVTTDMLPRPSTVYACTKLFGEALARYYSDIHGMSCIVIRLCYFRGYDDPLLRIPGHDIQREWCSPRDLAQLVVKCIRTDLPFGIFFGLSNNRDRCWDISNARQMIGYEPQDDAATFLVGN
jgi:nucleoside-diphosphate-sugar epimerase